MFKGVKRWAWRQVRSDVRMWLMGRAFHVPETEVAEVAARFGLSVPRWREVEAELGLLALERLDEVIG